MNINNATSQARRSSGGIGEFVKTLIYAGLIAIGVRTVAFEAFNIPSGSMIPTLLIGDYLFVTKYSYGYSRYSLPFGMPLIPGPDRLFGSVPQRGDVVVFKNLKDDGKDYIKRVIGLPGDRLQMRAGRLYINGTMVERRLANESGSPAAPGRPTEFIETLPGGVSHRIWEFSDSGMLDNTPEYLVPANHLFMMGDNRDQSQDSRVLDAVGYVPLENVIGRARIMFFSTDGTSSLFPWTWFTAIRYDRLLQIIR